VFQRAELRSLRVRLNREPLAYPIAPPNAPFTPDANTVGLHHFDEGSGTTVLDASGASGGPSHGERRVGGPHNGPTYDAVIKRF